VSKHILILLILAAMTAISGCGQSSVPQAEAVVQKYFAHMLQGEVIEASRYTNHPEADDQNRLVQMATEMVMKTVVAKVESSGLKVEVTGSRLDNDEALVYFKIMTTKYTGVPDRTDSLTCVRTDQNTWVIDEGMLMTSLLGMDE